jgi:GNAT superfamily N-acetyltransferase
MSELLGRYPLKDRLTDNDVEATLWQSIDDRHVQDFVQKWKPIFDARLAELKSQGRLTDQTVAEYNLQDAHWHWVEKARARAESLSWASFAVEAEGVTQGLMFVRMGPDVRAREASQLNQYIVDVDLLAAAPWNRFRLVPKPQFKGIGRLLLATAISLSVSEEFAGRIGLHALPQAESWYRDVCGMTDLGVDETKMRYFEMTPAQARAFVQQ